MSTRNNFYFFPFFLSSHPLSGLRVGLNWISSQLPVSDLGECQITFCGNKKCDASHLSRFWEELECDASHTKFSHLRLYNLPELRVFGGIQHSSLLQEAQTNLKNWKTESITEERPTYIPDGRRVAVYVCVNLTWTNSIILQSRNTVDAHPLISCDVFCHILPEKRHILSPPVQNFFEQEEIWRFGWDWNMFFFLPVSSLTAGSPLRVRLVLLIRKTDRSFVLTLFIFKAPNYVLTRTLTERVV